MALPFMTKELAMRIEHCDTAQTVARMTVLQEQDGNPYGIDIRRFGQATALMARESSNALFNRVMEFGPEDIEHLDEVIDWYKQAGVRFRFEIIPFNADQSLFEALVSRGFYQSRFVIGLYGEPHLDPVSYPEIVIKEVQPDQADTVPEGDFMSDSIKAFVGHPSARYYEAEIDGEHAAFAILFLVDDIGYCALSDTSEPFRRRGCQKALLQRRMLDAADAGCGLVAAHTAVNNVISLNNMEKMGFRIAYTEAVWTEYQA